MSKSSSSMIKKKYDQKTQKKGILDKFQSCQIVIVLKNKSDGGGSGTFLSFCNISWNYVCMRIFFFSSENYWIHLKLMVTIQNQQIFCSYYMLGDSACVSPSIAINLGYCFYCILQMRKEALALVKVAHLWLNTFVYWVWSCDWDLIFKCPLSQVSLF